MASSLMNPPSITTGFSPSSDLSEVISTAAQASPRLSPSRAASYGLQGEGLRDLKEAKPLEMNSQSRSQPTITTLLHFPPNIILRATTKALAPEMQALESSRGLRAQPRIPPSFSAIAPGKAPTGISSTLEACPASSSTLPLVEEISSCVSSSSILTPLSSQTSLTQVIIRDSRRVQPSTTG